MRPKDTWSHPVYNGEENTNMEEYVTTNGRVAGMVASSGDVYLASVYEPGVIHTNEGFVPIHKYLGFYVSEHDAKLAVLKVLGIPAVRDSLAATVSPIK